MCIHFTDMVVGLLPIVVSESKDWKKCEITALYCIVLINQFYAILLFVNNVFDREYLILVILIQVIAGVVNHDSQVIKVICYGI